MSVDDIPSPDSSSTSALKWVFAVGIVFVVGLILLGAGYHQVPEGHVGVYKKWGAVTGNTADPGAHIILPVQQSVQNIEVRPRTYTMVDAQGEGERSATRDAIEVQSINGTTFRVDVAVQYRVNPDNAAAFVEEWRTVNQAEQRLIRQAVRSAVRDQGGAIQSSTIFTQAGRQQLDRAATEALRERFADEPLTLENVYIRGVNIPDSYQQSLNQKEIAKQEVQREEFRVQQQRLQAQRQIIQAQASARQRLIRANATARSNYIIARSLSNDVLVYQYINSLDRANTIYVPVGDGGLPTFLNVASNSTVNRSAIPPAGGAGGGFDFGNTTVGQPDVDQPSVNATQPTPTPAGG